MSHPDTKKAFELLVLPQLDFLFGMALRLTRDRTSAEDLVQESVLKALRSFARFEPGSNARAWVSRILINTFFTQEKREKRMVRDVDVDEFPATESQPAGSIVSSLDDVPRDAFGDEVLAALDELPAGMAIAVYLADVENIPYTEIAEMLEIPLGTVRSRIARGRRHLQERLLSHAQSLGWAARKLS